MAEEIVMNVKLKLDQKDLKLQVEQALGSGLLSGLSSGGGKKKGGLLDKSGAFGSLITGINQGVELLKKISNVLEAASPSWAATAGILKQSMLLFFKPFGDFLGALLRPMAISLLRFAIKWQSIFGGFSAKEADETIEKIGAGEELTEAEKKNLLTSLGGINDPFGFRFWELFKARVKIGFENLWTNTKIWFNDLIPDWSWSWDGLKQWLKDLLPTGSGSGLLSGIGSLLSSGYNWITGIFDDFIVQNGQISKFSPDDTIIGVKDTRQLGGRSINIRVDSLLTGDIVEQIADRVRREVMMT